jgi:precorrin-6B methylase 2
MSLEFTGERVIPGQVEADLWNEHLARYLFAARIARHRHVLDIGCGTGYGTAELGKCSQICVGLDFSRDAVAYARANFNRPNLRWLQASADTLPFAPASFDLVICFEVIEHLERWPDLLKEVARILRRDGQFIVSTPNRDFYSASRDTANPFHVHEFTYDEFRAALSEHFTDVRLFAQDHTQGILIRPLPSTSKATEVSYGSQDAPPQHSNFYVAVCANLPQTGAPTFVYLPSDANVLRERSLHIERLNSEIRLKEAWITEARQERDTLAEKLRESEAALAERTEWAQKLEAELIEAQTRITQLQTELTTEQQAAQTMAREYEAKVTELEADVASRTQWALDTEQRLTGELAERDAALAQQAGELAEAERLLEERTRWALNLDRERETLAAQVNAAYASRWLKLGRTLGLGPRLPSPQEPPPQ